MGITNWFPNRIKHSDAVGDKVSPFLCCATKKIRMNPASLNPGFAKQISRFHMRNQPVLVLIPCWTTYPAVENLKIIRVLIAHPCGMFKLQFPGEEIILALQESATLEEGIWQDRGLSDLHSHSQQRDLHSHLEQVRGVEICISCFSSCSLFSWNKDNPEERRWKLEMVNCYRTREKTRTWEKWGRWNDRGVRHLEWEGANKACGTAWEGHEGE